jgi:hypothetical protein
MHPSLQPAQPGPGFSAPPSATGTRAVLRSTVLRVLFGLLALAAGVASAPAGAEAQNAGVPAAGDTIYEVRLTGGSVLFGSVVRADATTVTLQTTAGAEITLARAQIQSMLPARGQVVDGVYWREDPNTSRLFFGPTARTIRQGDGYFGVYELFIPFVSFGVTDDFTISGGSPFYIGMFGAAPPIYVAPKLRIASSEAFDLAVGGLLVVIPSEDYTFGVGYGVGTYGTRDHAFTAGLGWGYVEDEVSSRPVVMIGGETRTGRTTKIITENWFVPGSDGVLLSGGVRFFGERLSADAGLIGFLGSEDTGCCFPLVNFVYHFGGGR